MSLSGDSALIGTPNDDCAAGIACGSAYVFVRNGTSWAQEDQLAVSNLSAFDFFGGSVSLENDTALIGASGADSLSGLDTGAAYIFNRSSSIWVEQQKLETSSIAVDDSFGTSVALSDSSLIIGASRSDANGLDSGAAYIFNLIGGIWVEQVALSPSDIATGDRFGAAVDIEQDQVVISSIFDDDAGSSSGSIYVFQRVASQWLQQTKIVSTDAALGDWTGDDVAISGETLLVGVVRDDDGGTSSGSAYIHVLDADRDVVTDSIDNCPAVTNADQANNDITYEQQEALGSLGDVCDLDDDNGALLSPPTPAEPNFGLLDLKNTPDSNVIANVNYSYIPDVGYLGPNQLCYEIGNLPAWATFDNATGQISGVPADDDFGDYNNISLSATEVFLTPSQGVACATLAVLGGQSLTSAPFSITVDDITPPVVIGPTTGISNSTIPVTLTCVEALGSGCAEIYYSIDAPATTASNALGITGPNFNGQVDITTSGTLHFIAEDNAGNISAEATATFTIDTLPPTLSIATPSTDVTATSVQMVGAVSDTESGVASVDIAIADTPTGGVTVNNNISATVNTLNNCVGDAGDGSTMIVLPAPCWQASYTPQSIDGSIAVTVTAVDVAGNSTQVSTQFNNFLGTPQFTTLDLNLTSSSVMFNGELDVVVNLDVPGGTADLTGEVIDVVITSPSSVVTNLSLTVNSDGQATQSAVGDGSDVTFNERGTWSLQANFVGSIRYAPSSSSSEALLVGTSAGYAVLIQGRAPSSEGLETHNKTLNRVYDTLRRRNFEDQNILYFNYDPLIDTNNDGIVDAPNPGVDFDVDFGKAFMQTQIENLAFFINNNPAPLYVVMVDHGNTGAGGSEFLIDNAVDGNVTITPTELDGWLDTLESNLTTEAAQEARVIINGSCYAGGFIEALTGANGVAAQTLAGDPLSPRVVITSAAADEVSYKGPLEADGIRVGEYFIEELFDRLDRGENLRDAFVVATDQTEIFTRSSDTASINGQFLDTAVQHPLICDNNDGVGSNAIEDAITDNSVDGNLASTLFLGTSAQSSTNSLAVPAAVIRTTETVFLPAGTASPADSTASLVLEANDNAEVGFAFIEIRSPATTFLGGNLSSSGVTEQLDPDELTTLALDAPATNGCAANEFCRDVDTFTAPGLYEVYYYVEDTETGELSTAVRSLVYKQSGGNVNSPVTFDLLSPGSATPGATITESAAIFRWESNTDVLNNQRVDADGDRITYTLRLCEDALLTDNCREYDQITTPFKAVMGLVSSRTVLGVASEVTYYWQVTAIDSFGASTASTSVYSFEVDDVNNLVGVIQGLVLSTADGARLQNHAIARTDGATSNPLYINASTDDVTGEYSLITLSSTSTGVPIEATVPGFEVANVSAMIPESCSELQILLQQCSPTPVVFNFILAPEGVDSDGDGVDDGDDNCPDDVNADQANFDNDAEGDVCDADDDNDLISDADEDSVVLDPNDVLNPFDASDAVLDSDGDGLSNRDEINVYGTQISNADSDGDGVDDGAEVSAGTDPNNADAAIHVPIPAWMLWLMAASLIIIYRRRGIAH